MGQIKDMRNITFQMNNLDEEEYNSLIDFLEDHYINYEETDIEEYQLDTRTEEEKYDNWLSEQADLHNDNVKMGLE